MTDDMRLLLRILFGTRAEGGRTRDAAPQKGTGSRAGGWNRLCPRLRAEEKRKEQKIP